MNLYSLMKYIKEWHSFAYVPCESLKVYIPNCRNFTAENGLIQIKINVSKTE